MSGNITLTRARHIARLITTAPPAPGFMGAGHEAVAVVSPDAITMSHPFILRTTQECDFVDWGLISARKETADYTDSADEEMADLPRLGELARV